MKTALLCDLGGTNIRFALSEDGGRPGAVHRRKTEEFPDFLAAARAYLDGRAVDRAAVCVAGPVHGGRVRMTNLHWSLDSARIADELALEAADIVNDFEAQALALPHLGEEGTSRVGDAGKALPMTAMAVLGPGTGLGVAGLVPLPGGGWRAVPGEGGHATLAAATEDEAVLLARLRERFGHVSAERALSGQGLVNLYRALTGDWGPKIGSREISARAGAGEPAALAAHAHFSAFLGTVAGDVALTLGARGGVFLAGGMLAGLGRLFDAGRFRRRFERKGRFSPYLADIPTFKVTEPEPALLGLSALAAVRSDPS